MQINSLYLSSTKKNSGMVAISLGLIQLLKTKFHKVAIFKPIIKDTTDKELIFLKEYFSLSLEEDKLFLYDLDRFEKLVSEDKLDDIVTNIIEHYELLKQQYDFVLVFGLSKEYISSLDFDINYKIAKNISTPFINIINGYKKQNQQIIEDIKLEYNAIKKEKLNYYSTFVNKIDKNSIKILKKQLKKQDLKDIYILPYLQTIQNLTINDIYTQLNTQLLYGSKKFLNQQINDIKVISMTLDNCLEYINENDLIIVSKDRSDIIAGLLLLLKANKSKKIAAILLSGNLEINNNFDNLLKSYHNISIAILGIKDDTFTTAMKVKQIKPQLTKKSYSKISLLLGIFTKYIEPNFTIDTKNTKNIMTPLMFEYNIFNLAKQNKKHIVLPESEDDRILRAAEILLHQRIVKITLLGDKTKIQQRAKILGLDITKASIIDPAISSLTKDFASKLYILRKHKGMLFETALEIIKHEKNYFATMMVQENYADGMVSGASSTTANTVRPALQIIKTKKDIDIVSSVFFICMDTKVLVFADCAINPNPTATQLAQIASSSIATAKAFNIESKVAMLSYSTGNSGSGADVDKIIEATKLTKKQNSSIEIEGPIQYDAAVDKTVSKKKLPNSKVAGDASILIFPDLNSGNNTYKAVQRSSGAVAIGPILQGLNKPVNDLSRGCSVKDIINTVAITAIQ